MNAQLVGKLMVFCLALAGFRSIAWAEPTIYIWQGTEADDPLEPANYWIDGGTQSTVLPTAGDCVRLEKDAVWRLTDSSIGQFKDLTSISAAAKVTDSSPCVILELSNDVSVSAAFDFQAGTSGSIQVVKKGNGTLSLTSAKGGEWDDAQGRHQDLAAKWKVEGGTLVFLQAATANATYMLSTLEVAAAGTAVLFGNGARTQLTGLSGAGLVTNYTGTAKVTLTGTNRSVYSGKIQGKIQLTVQNELWLTGLENNCTLSALQTYGTSYGAGTLGLASLGTTAGGGASIGGTGELSVSSAAANSGRILLLNDAARSTDRALGVSGSETLPATIDAGAYGGYTFTGDWNIKTKSMHRLELSGSNTLECVADNSICDYASGGTNYSFYLSKTGTGIWRLANAANPFSGGIAVENGVLRFDSIAEKGEPCALGTATNLYESCTGVKDETLHPAVDYAFKLGGGADAAKEGVFAYTGAADAKCSTRPAVVTGRARLLNASQKAFDFSGVKSIGDTPSVLTLDGAGSDNVLRNVSDGVGAASLGIAKEGSGTWTLDGTLDFTGPISVNAGTLVVRGNRDYNWFKFTFKENFAVVSNLTSNHKGIHLSEFALYDANGTRRNIGLALADHDQVGEFSGTLEPGQVAYGVPVSMVTTNETYAGNSPNKLFDQSRDTRWNCYAVNQMYGDVPATWVSIVLRLSEGSPRISAFDFGGAPSKYYQWNPRVFSIAGSVDGLGWHDVYSNSDASLPYLNTTKNMYSYWWNGGNLVGTAAKPESDAPCAFTYDAHESRTVLPDGVKLFVASNGTFRVEGDALTVKELTIDCSGDGGAIENVDFVNEGILNLVNLPSGAASVSFTMSRVENFDRVAGWALKLNGRDYSGRSVSVDGSTIRLLQPKGSVIVVR